MGFSKIRKLFKRGNVSVFGNCGAGKDLLFGNVAVRSSGHIGNVCYGKNYYPVDFNVLDVGTNTYDNFIRNDVNKYEYPYPVGVDHFYSDCGIIFPAQYCNELNKKYPYFATFFAIRRHLGQCNVHTNSQALSRVWDKLREQSDTYILCRGVFKPLLKLGIVVQLVTTYDRYESAQARLKPCRVRSKLLSTGGTRMQADIARDNYANTHGEVKNHILIYLNKAKYDTHHFKKLLEGGKTN